MLRFPVQNMLALGQESFPPPEYTTSVMLPQSRPQGDALTSAATAAGAAVGTGMVIWGLVDMAAIAASAYHGYKRNNSTGWAIWWGLMGGLFPIITVPVAFAQGFGKRSK